MVVSLTDDKDNLFVVLTARGMNPTMRIVARFVDERSAEKMRKAGANATVSPNAIGGLRMASEALRPSVVSFLDIMLRSSKATLRVEEATVAEASRLANRPLRDSSITEQTGLLVLAIRGTDGEYHFNPHGHTVLKPGLTLIVMGEMDGVKKLKVLSGEKV
jgi:voltage-gated potassium channel